MVIDYVIGDGEVRDKVCRMVVGERVDSDHHPLEVTIGRRMRERNKRGEGRRK